MEYTMTHWIAIVGGLVLMSLAAGAQEYYIDGKPATKVDAIVTLAKNPGAQVVRCQPQELSEKATLRNKKKK